FIGGQNMSINEEISELNKALLNQDRKMRINAVNALGKIGNADVVELLIKAMKDVDFGVRAFAAEALGKIGDERALDPLIQALNDAYYAVRRDAATALGELGDVRAVDALTATMMRHKTGFCREDDSVHDAAKDSLEKLQKKY
ncbi:MAG: HEAT repeat domain-containing protein, partial [Anaerolineaceae bacterium]|nr:HEAT repeat domain-containing protein [Anaerolineaceae bacterium]